jgi:hypothetical protein
MTSNNEGVTVLCLIIDDEKKPFGRSFSVKVSSSDSINDLVKMINAEGAPHFDNILVQQILVWRCPGLRTAEGARELGREELEHSIGSIDFSRDATSLYTLANVKDLQLDKHEVLLIQLPGKFSTLILQ